MVFPLDRGLTSLETGTQRYLVTEQLSHSSLRESRPTAATAATATRPSTINIVSYKCRVCCCKSEKDSSSYGSEPSGSRTSLAWPLLDRDRHDFELNGRHQRYTRRNGLLVSVSQVLLWDLGLPLKFRLTGGPCLVLPDIEPRSRVRLDELGRKSWP